MELYQVIGWISIILAIISILMDDYYKNKDI